MAIAEFFATIQDMTSSVAKKPLSSFSNLETAGQDGIVVAKDGSLMSVVKVDGIKQVLGADELRNIVEQLATKMSSYFGKSGHAVQVWFTRDPDLSATVIRSQQAPARGVAAALQLDLKDLFDEREMHLPKFVVYEGFFLAVWTRTSAMTKPERAKARLGSKPPSLWPRMADTQNMFTAAKPLYDRHRSFVSSLLQDFGSVDIRVKLLNSHNALRAVKWSLNPDLIDADWKPTLVGDPTPERRAEIHPNDASHFLWPKLDNQLFDREADRINQRIVRIGNRYWAGVDMTVGPQDVQPFHALLTRMIDIREFPWRISYLLEGDGLRSLHVKQFLASIFAMTNGENKAIRDAIKALRENSYSEDVIPVRMRVSLATWAPSTGAPGEVGLIEERASRLQRAVESWGYCSVSASAGDPVAGVLSSALGLDVATTAPPGCVPIDDVLRLLPWDRDASPWSRGAIMFRTPDGRVWPYQQGSSQQDAFIDIIFAPPGKGKSVYLNTANLAACLSPAATQGYGGVRLPRIAIIDVGPSSAGLVSLIKEALPPSRRHEAEYHRLRMAKEHAINPFDTQLGVRRPFMVERSFLVNFLSALGTPAGDDKPPNGLPDLAGACIDELYRLLDDNEAKSQPKRYVPDRDVVVDTAIAKYGIEVNKGTIWWSVVDQLYMHGAIHEATLAQRFAVPKLDDIGTVLHLPKIQDVHGSAKSESGELTWKMFERMFISAITEFPILQSETRFDIGDSRVVSLDLDDVAPRGGKQADKQTALMYMLARFVLAKDFYLNPELLRMEINPGVPLIPDLYRDHHSQRINRLRETPKRLVYDEFHRTASSPGVRAQVLADIREGRKWNVHVALASQLIDDFDKDMVDMASGVWIMGVGNQREAERAADLFKISDTGRHIMSRRLTGPSAKGSPFLCILSLKEGRHEHLLYNTLGPNELWAFSTTSEDASLRNRCYVALGAQEARRRLARAFPGGSAKGEIERRQALALERGERVDEASDGLVAEIAREIIGEGRSDWAAGSRPVNQSRD